MGVTYAEIELISTDDLAFYSAGYIQEDQIKRVKVRALVDSGSTMLAINRSIRNQLDLRKLDEREGELADGSLTQLDIVGPVEVRFENRRATVDAIVLPGDTEVLLGAIPMEDMDVVVDPKQERLIVNPQSPERARMLLKGVIALQQ